MKSKETIRGAEGFMHYYAEIYRDRWASLISALQAEGKGIGLRCLPAGGYILEDPSHAGPSRDAVVQRTTVHSGEAGEIEEKRDELPVYRLDKVSVIAAEALILPQRGRVLDACAAPGGKTLVLAARMSPETRLVANELSAERRRRLKTVVADYLPPSLRSRIQVTGYDASSVCRKLPAAFDAILLDAPCSSERHLLGDPEALGRWSPARTRNLACRQWALLSSAFIMLAPGGCLVYSTCSISPEENDGVAGRLVKKYGDAFTYVPLDESGGEKTLYGSIFLPDTCGGGGPMYIARIVKRQI